jgi:hypothetical protein
MEKGNGQETDTQPGTTTVPAGGTTTGIDTGTGTAATPPSVAAPTGGGGSQADQSGPQQGQTQERRREVLYQGYAEVPHPDGSVLRLDGNGGATFTDGLIALRLEGDQWVDARSGQQSHIGHKAKADHRLRSLEMDRGLRKSMTQ